MTGRLGETALWLWLAAFGVLSITSAQAQTANAKPIKIGVLGDMSGYNADISGKGAVEAVKMAVEDFGGNVLGRPIEVVSADHQNKPDIASNIARRWYDTEDVEVITDIVGSGNSLAVMSLANERKKLAFPVNASSSDINGKFCNPYTLQYNFDSYALAKATTKAILKTGGDSWFFVTADYTFGHTTQKDVEAFVKEGGGKVLGAVRHPAGTADFSSFILAAQASGAKVIALANASSDTVNSIRTASEYGITRGGKQTLAGMLYFISDTHALGLNLAQGLTFTTSFYWDMNDETRAWSKRYFARVGKMPTMVHAANYSAIMHYLNNVKATGSLDADTVMASMKKMPINDFYTKGGKIRDDGLMIHDLFLMQVKAPQESKYDWDYYKLIAKVPAEEAFRPASESQCPLLKKS
ncbi:ABC transporter substrate-binding protein [Bradyrhizobium lablabi]|uniref:ABC transporter substrate-binding protein n=1 Tax=Bradyrhizobium lablabi TaxID=722472 RepID=UPI001BAA73B2|nr:ABC transporter substrate-binding protein [Bradyrhizobium lablabi]MBR1122533.1 ABC transporter substrate-binding protein [Bradyrhizobium lablabi]